MRQTKEGDIIANYQAYNLLNKRVEWGNNLPPILEVEYMNGRRKQHQGNQKGYQPPRKRRKVSEQEQEVQQQGSTHGDQEDMQVPEPVQAEAEALEMQG